jgi:hypothetical protein
MWISISQHVMYNVGNQNRFLKKLLQIAHFKGIVQRDLTGVESGITL